MWMPIYLILWCGSFTMMANGELRLLVIGGEASRSRYKLIISDVELLDPFDAGSNCIKPPDLPFPRKCFVSEYLGGDRPFIIGGGNTGVMYVTSLVLINNTWWNTPIKLNHPRYCATSSQLHPSMMWVVGGDTDGTNKGMTTEILKDFTLATQINYPPKYNVQPFINASINEKTRFRDIFNAPKDDDYSKSSRKCLAKINETHSFLTGYQNGLSYIVDSTKLPYSFTPLPKMMFGSHNGGACTTIRDSLGVTRVLVAGGGDTKLHKVNLELMKKSEFLKLDSYEWIEGPDLPRMFYMGGFVQYPDDRGFVLLGGEDLKDHGRIPRHFSDVMRYNQTTNKFEYLPKSLAIPRSRFGAMLVETSNDENCTIVSKITTSHANSLPTDQRYLGTITFYVVCFWTLLVGHKY